MIKKKFKRQSYIVFILLLSVIFVAGILLGKSLETKETTEVNRHIKDLELNTESFLIEQELVGLMQNDCELAEERISDLSTELYNLGLLLNKPDAEEQLGDDNFNLLKRKYQLMQVRTYLLYNTFKKNCKESTHVILFFYGPNDENSKEQGFILDELVKKYDFKVFALEFGYSKELNFLETSYDITNYPSVVIDYIKVKNGLTTYAEIINEII